MGFHRVRWFVHFTFHLFIPIDSCKYRGRYKVIAARGINRCRSATFDTRIDRENMREGIEAAPGAVDWRLVAKQVGRVRSLCLTRSRYGAARIKGSSFEFHVSHLYAKIIRSGVYPRRAYKMWIRRCRALFSFPA